MEPKDHKGNDPTNPIAPLQRSEGCRLLPRVGIKFRRIAAFRCGKNMHQAIFGSQFPAAFFIKLNLFFRQALVVVQKMW